MELRIGNKYRLGRKLGEGSFGDVFMGKNIISNDEVAIKLENRNAKHPQLHIEAKFLKMLQGGVGIPKLKWAGVEGDYNCLVMDLLGPSLEHLLNFCKRRFSLKTTLLLADQFIARIEFLHSKNFIHRDIKPDNFLMGIKNRGNLLYVIDFGLVKRYFDPKTGKHIEYKEGRSLTGTARYASLNTHLGCEQSRRDDMESIGYILIYFLDGCLPWQGIQVQNRKTKYDTIAEKKASLPIEELCGKHPKEFSIYLNYVRTLRFDEKPDYMYLRSLFRQLFKRQGYAYDYVFDWSRERIEEEDSVQKNKSENLKSGESQKNSHNLKSREYQHGSSQKQHEKQPDVINIHDIQNKYANYIESSPNMHYQTINPGKSESNPYLPSRNKYGSNTDTGSSPYESKYGTKY